MRFKVGEASEGVRHAAVGDETPVELVGRLVPRDMQRALRGETAPQPASPQGPESRPMSTGSTGSGSSPVSSPSGSPPVSSVGSGESGSLTAFVSVSELHAVAVSRAA